MIAGAAALLGIALVCALAIAVSPRRQSDRPAILATLALATAAALQGDTLWQSDAATLSILALAAAALIPPVVLSRAFGRVDMLAVLFHRDFGLHGATLGGMKNQIASAVGAALVAFAALAGLLSVLRAGPWGTALAAGLLVAANPATGALAAALGRRLNRPPVPPPLMQPRLQTGAGASPDLVIVYLEGTDRRFSDTSVFGDCYAPVAALAAQGLSFSRIGQIAGTGWSLAGMVASQSGVPLLPRGFKIAHGTDRVASFMRGVTFLGDVLAARGYDSHYVVGSTLDFGGIGRMYADHGIAGQTGLHEIRAMFPAAEVERARVDWFLDDQMVFDAARTRHAAMLAAPAPFALIVETIGPHGQTSYLPRSASPDGQARRTSDIRRAVKATTGLAADFLQHVRTEAQRRGRPLRIVVLSDHLCHHAATPRATDGTERWNTVILLGDASTDGRRIDRQGSMIDVFPTLLDWLGWAQAPVAAGFGRSLLADAPTLVEEHGFAATDAMFEFDPALSRRIWDGKPAIASGPGSA